MPELTNLVLSAMLVMWTTRGMLEVSKRHGITSSRDALVSRDALASRDALVCIGTANLATWACHMHHCIQYVSAKTLIHCTAHLESSYADLLYTMKVTCKCE